MAFMKSWKNRRGTQAERGTMREHRSRIPGQVMSARVRVVGVNGCDYDPMIVMKLKAERLRERATLTEHFL